MSQQRPEGSVTVEQARSAGRLWEFYRDDDGWWFGQRPDSAAGVDLYITHVSDLDNLQVLCATAYLQRCGRNEDAARLFATQTGCTPAEAREFCGNGEVPPDAVFAPPPWPLTQLEAAKDFAAQQRARGRRGLLAYGAGILLALIAAIVIITLL